MIPRKPRANRVALLSLLSFLMATVAVGAGPSGRGPVLGQKLPSASDTSLLVEGQWGGAYQAVALSPDGGLAYVGSGAGSDAARHSWWICSTTVWIFPKKGAPISTVSCARSTRG